MTTHHHNQREPFIDQASSTVIADASITLSAARGQEHVDDITAEIQVLTSLRLQLDEHILCIITEARETGCSWHDIAEALGETTTHARRRYNTGQRPDTTARILDQEATD